jgi:hypothetical protein
VGLVDAEEDTVLEDNFPELGELDEDLASVLVEVESADFEFEDDFWTLLVFELILLDILEVKAE